MGSKSLIEGEPKENKLAVGAKGSLRVETITRGRAVHSAYPDMGESAVLKLLDVLEDVRRMKFDPHPLLGETTRNFGILEGGTKANIIPDLARAEMMFHSAGPLQGIKEGFEGVADGKAEIRHTLELPIVMMNAVEGFDTTPVTFSGDVPLFTEWGRPCLLGPGSILDAHPSHERISNKQLQEGVDLYVRLAAKLLSR